MLGRMVIDERLKLKAMGFGRRCIGESCCCDEETKKELR